MKYISVYKTFIFMIYQLVSVLFDGFVVISATLFKISKVVYSFKDYGNFKEIRVWSVFQ